MRPPTLPHWLTALPWQGLAAAAVVVACAVAADRLLGLALERALARFGRAGDGGGAPDSLVTRLRVLRRLGRVGIYLVALAAALSHFPWLRVLSAGLWASAGVAGLVVGMAAKGTLSNAIAGVTLAFSQPFRVGDCVTLRGEVGVVEDITLMYTLIRTGDNRRLVIPNDLLSTEVLYNHSIADPRILATVHFHVRFEADLAAAKEALTKVALESPSRHATAGPPTAAVAETGPASVRLDVSGWTSDQGHAWAFQADVRERGLAALQALGALPPTTALPSTR